MPKGSSREWDVVLTIFTKSIRVKEVDGAITDMDPRVLDGFLGKPMRELEQHSWFVMKSRVRGKKRRL